MTDLTRRTLFTLPAAAAASSVEIEDEHLLEDPSELDCLRWELWATREDARDHKAEMDKAVADGRWDDVSLQAAEINLCLVQAKMLALKIAKSDGKPMCFNEDMARYQSRWSSLDALEVERVAAAAGVEDRDA